MEQTNKYFVGEPYWTTPHNIKLDEKIAKFNPPKPEHEYEALKAQIERDGQVDPVYVRGGLLGDGTHRTRIAQELGRKILVQEIDVGIPDAEYIRLCNKNTFGARNDTPAQVAIKAYTLVKEYGYTATEANKIAGVKDRNSIAYIRYIADTRHASVLTDIKNGGKAVIKTKEGEIVYKGVALKLIKEKIARLEEEEMLEVDTSCEINTVVDYNIYLNTETAKDVFWSNVGNNEFVSMDTKKLFCELLNLKYKLKDEPCKEL